MLRTDKNNAIKYLDATSHVKICLVLHKFD